MDESPQSGLSEAAATRKRRSSILKCHRPPRAPFSELEFNVATPTDTAKSRRVSFSRRTGVAEFVTNEATTTWKNFYEEHNKTSESSGNESEMNPAGQSVGNLGRGLFEQQLEEEVVEAVDLFANMEKRDFVETSINNINFAQQIASLECLDDRKLTVPHQNFEMSSLTNSQIKIFGDDLAISGTCEITDRISVNLSAVQPIGVSENDDLDAIQRDIRSVQSLGLGNMIGSGSGAFGQNMSEYIEIDLNTTQAAIRNEESDMSITDTILNSKVQDVPKSNLSFAVEKKKLDKDWITDKENILINPYIAPRETSNFAINEESDKILVFDGKRLTIQCDEKESDSTNFVLSHVIPEEKIKRKTIVLNRNDDLPNFIEDPCDPVLQGRSRSFVFDKDEIENNMSMTQALNAQLEIDTKERKSILYASDNGNISLTKAIPSNILIDEKSGLPHSETLSVSQSDNVSMHPLPNTILPESRSMPNRCNTILYEDDVGEVSLTQALPSKLLAAKESKQEDVSGKRRTIVFETDSADVSITQAIPSNLVLSEKSSTALGKRKTIVFEDEAGNISITQAVPANLIFSKKGNITPKERTVVYETDVGDISLTQIVPSDLILPQKCTSMPDRRKTVIYEDNDGNLSITQAVPTNVMMPHNESSPEKMRTVVFESDKGNISITQAVDSNVPNIKKSEDCKIPSPGRLESVLVEKEISKLDKSPIREDSVTAEKEIKNPDLPQENSEHKLEVSQNNAIEIDARKEEFHIESVDAMKIKNEEKQNVLIESDDPCITQTSVDQNVPINIETNSALAKENLLNPDHKDSTVQCATSTSYLMKTKEEVHEVIPSISEASDVCEKDRPAHVASIPHDKSPEALLKKRLKKTTIAFENDDEARSISKPIPSYLALSELEETKDAMKFSQYIPHNVVVYKAGTDAVHSPKSHDSVSEATPITRSYENMEFSESSNKITPKDSVIKSRPSVTFKEVSDTKRSILDDLLDMSNVDMADGFDDKNIMAKIESENPSDISANCAEEEQTPVEKDQSIDVNASKESLFYITKDSTTDVLKLEETKNEKLVNDDALKKDESYNLIEDIQKKLEKFKKQVDEDSLKQRTEKVVSMDLDYEKVESKPISEPVSSNIITKSAKTASDTHELLDWISEYTDREEEKNPVIEVQSSVEAPTNDAKLAIVDKCSAPETQVSLLPKRRSIVLSREDLINNISMAQAVLQKSRAEFEVSEVMDDTETTSMISTDQIDHATQSKKMVRVSNEVVKKLHFEEDMSFSEDSYGTSEFQRAFSPVKKTAFGEESYMRENKANVIPTYLKDVSDGIKQLIGDLVKPTADTLPFETVRVDKGVRKVPSTASLEVQANLMESSQVDLTEVESTFKIHRSSMINDIRRSSLSSERDESVKKSVQFIPSEKLYEPEVLSVIPPLSPSRRPEMDRVLVFDHNNPLNNILLAPTDFSEVHSYNPVRSEERLNEANATSEQTFPNTTDDKESDKSNICIQRVTFETERYVVKEITTTSLGLQCDAQETESESENKSVPESVSIKKSASSDENSDSTISKPRSLDQSIGALVVEMKDTEVNTAIVMKSTEELLQNSSSLTLVDDAISRSSRHIVATGNTRLIYKMDERAEDELQKTDSEYTSPDRERRFSPDQAKQAEDKPKQTHKRVHSPRHKKSHNSTLEPLDVTPKPASKIPKRNYSPPTQHASREPRIDYDSTTSQSESGKESRSGSRSPDARSPKQKRSPRKLKLSPKEQGKVPPVTVQRLNTEYNIDSKVVNMEVFKKSHLTDVSEESEGVAQVEKSQSMRFASPTDSARSERSGRSERSERSEGSRALSSDSQSKTYSVEWQPELVNELSSKNLVTECESGVNVVAKIDTLPFMGSHECEWKSAHNDTWVFRLLHGRLRLSVRLAHRLDNQPRAAVRADTRVLRARLERSHHENKNPVAILCVRFALEAMRHALASVGGGGGVSRAGEVPALLCACAGVARVALQWGRAMHRAQRRLAFSLADDGRLDLKVANIPLRSVWEVSMRVALVAGEGREVPWPEATDVDVTAVVSDFPVSRAEGARALAGLRRDWGHAPAAVWRIFKYLKSKSSDDDLLLFSGR